VSTGSAVPSGGSRYVNYEEWAALLAEHFFRPEFDGVPVMFFVDDDAVAKLYGGDLGDAVGSLVSAVRGRLDCSRPRQLFRHIKAEARRWKRAGADATPPFLPLLAVAVLAATRMQRTREHAAHNYYQPFRDLLGVDVEIDDLQASSGDALPHLWRYLQWWLDNKHRGGLGFSTIVHGYFNYTYANSQTLFSSSDRDKLTQFFRWIRLKPGERVEQSELMTYFRIWASRRDDLSEGTAYILESEEYIAQLAQIIKAAADRWQGVVREDGRRGAEILVTLELFPRPRLGLVAERPEGFPAELPCRGLLGGELTLTATHDGWYDELQIAISATILDGGLRLAADGTLLSLRPYNVHVLEKNADLGKWASVQQVSPGEPAWLLVRQADLDEVCSYLDASARRGWKVIQREGIAPRGWRLVGEVLVNAASYEVPERLARIVPRTQNRFSLKGGLPLGRPASTYLTGGEPDLWLPPPTRDDTRFELQIDEQSLRLPPSTTRVRLADHALNEGAHTVTLEGIGRSFSTIRTLGPLARRVDQAIGHERTRARRPDAGRTHTGGTGAGAECQPGGAHRWSRGGGPRCDPRRLPDAAADSPHRRPAANGARDAARPDHRGPGTAQASLDDPRAPRLSGVRVRPRVRGRLDHHRVEPRADESRPLEAATPSWFPRRRRVPGRDRRVDHGNRERTASRRGARRGAMERLPTGD
jgi:hypothetical protein